MKYDPDDVPHQAAKSLITLIQQLSNDGRIHLVLNAAGHSIAEVHADKIAMECLVGAGIEVMQDKNLHEPHSYQVKLGPIRGPEAHGGLRSMLRNNTNFRLAFETALVRDSQQKRENAAGREENHQGNVWTGRTSVVTVSPNDSLVR